MGLEQTTVSADNCSKRRVYNCDAISVRLYTPIGLVDLLVVVAVLPTVALLSSAGCCRFLYNAQRHRTWPL